MECTEVAVPDQAVLQLDDAMMNAILQALPTEPGRPGEEEGEEEEDLERLARELFPEDLVRTEGEGWLLEWGSTYSRVSSLYVVSSITFSQKADFAVCFSDFFGSLSLSLLTWQTNLN